MSINGKQNILVIGGGGREHAIVWKLSKSPRVGKLYAIPGNAGIAELAECHPEIGAKEIDKIVAFVAERPDIGLTVVAPDDPLALGLVDRLTEKGFRAFGPTAAAAEIEASKVVAKNLMQKYGIPTARYATFSDYTEADQYLDSCPVPVVIKADGLALGKGVLICNTRAEAKAGLKEMMQNRAFGDAGKNVVIEEFLTGFEVSVLAFCDGKTVVPMASSQDHKRALDGDKGLNTGGMGTFSPSVRYTDAMAKRAYETVFLPTVAALNAENRTFRGVIYFGLMIDASGNIRVLEYNARFGDPETQVILPRLNNDLLDVFDACIDGMLHEIEFSWKSEACVCVVAASGGYPEQYATGKEITVGDLEDGIILFHAGTKTENGRLTTSGGRVLGVTALEDSLASARAAAYRAVDKIKFEGIHFRTDIAK
jgi:phosphoribosylamine--glycine ligase